MKQYFDYLATLEDACKLDECTVENFAKVRRFNFALLENLPLTDLEQSWIVQANQFFTGEKTVEELAKVRGLAWASLGKNDCDTKNPKIAQSRAVICTMYPDDFNGNENDMPVIKLEHIGVFFMRAGGSEEVAIKLLQQIFKS